MIDSEQRDKVTIDSIDSILGSLESNRFWPFTEGVYVLDELIPCVAATYAFIVICLDNKNATKSYMVSVDQCNQLFSAPFRRIASNLLIEFPVYLFKSRRPSENLRKSLTGKWHKQFRITMEQYFIEKGHILDEITQPWIDKYFKPARRQFENVNPMSEFINTALVYETISVPMVEKPPKGFKSQSFYEDGKPTVEFIDFMQVFRESTGITDPGSWEALRESEFYKALNLTREMANEKVKKAKKKLIGIRCYGEKTLLRDAYCFKRVVIDGEKEAKVAGELRNFRQTRYIETKNSLASYEANNGEYYLKKIILDRKLKHSVLTNLFTTWDIKLAPEMPLEWKVQAKTLDDLENPGENEVSKAITFFTKIHILHNLK